MDFHSAAGFSSPPHANAATRESGSEVTRDAYTAALSRSDSGFVLSFCFFSSSWLPAVASKCRHQSLALNEALIRVDQSRKDSAFPSNGMVMVTLLLFILLMTAEGIGKEIQWR